MDPRIEFEEDLFFNIAERDGRTARATLANRVVAFTGVLAYNTFEAYEVQALELGAKLVIPLGPDVDYLVVGNLGIHEWQERRYAEIIYRAMNRHDTGHTIELVTEQFFLKLLAGELSFLETSTH
jgi:hypothetical protein